MPFRILKTRKYEHIQLVPLRSEREGATRQRKHMTAVVVVRGKEQGQSKYVE